MSDAIKSFPLAAAVYVPGTDAFLTHACEVDSRGFPVRVLCGRAKLESVLDDATQGTDEAPTCKACQRKLAKRPA